VNVVVCKSVVLHLPLINIVYTFAAIDVHETAMGLLFSVNVF